MQDILDIFKYILPSIITFITAYFVINTFLNNEYKKKLMEIRVQNHGTITPIRLQAYERYALLLERIALTNLISRTHRAGMSARLLQSELTKAIRDEFDHNLAQQIYISTSAYDAIKTAKEETIKAINIAATKVPDDASGMDFVNVLVRLITSVEKLPTDIALELLKMEVKQLF